jgi:hypothetical protein
MSETDYYEIECTVLKHWDRAVLLDFGLEESVWIPYTQIYDDEDTVRSIPEGRHTSLEIAEWLLVQKRVL